MTVELERLVNTQWGGKILYSHGTNNSRGVAILFKKKSTIRNLGSQADSSGRQLIVKIQIESEQILLANIYAPNTDEPEFFTGFFNTLEQELTDKNELIIGGDFNLVLDIKMDKRGGNPITHKKSLQVIESFMQDLSLSDIWRFQHKHEKKFMWKNCNPTLVMVRLDFFLTSYGLLDKLLSTDILSSIQSDHDIPVLIYQHSNMKRGPGFWKFNTSLLQDEDYCSEAIQKINEIKAQKYDGPAEKLDNINMEMRGFTIKYATRKKKSETNKLQVIEHKIETINQDLAADEPLFNVKSNTNQLASLQREREEILKNKMKGAMIRTRREWLEHGESSSKYFFSLEKANYKRKNRFQLLLDDGSIIMKNSEILKEQHKFYQELYHSADLNMEELEQYLEGIEFEQVTQDDNQMLIQEISLQELKETLWDMPPDKVPGPEGFPPEYYRKFFSELGQLLLYVIQDASQQGFSRNISRGTISLMEKEGKNMMKISDWRPLSLLNTEFKLLSKILAERLNRVLLKIIHPDQCGFIKGGNLQDNILDLISATEYAEQENIPMILVNYDFKKAFDMVEWKVLFKIIKKFGFHDQYINMIENLFKGMTTCTTNCGFASEKISITRGLLQGSSISSSLFLLVVEVLGQKLRQKEKIEGISLEGGYQKKHGQYADDLWALIKDKQTCFIHLMDTVGEYCRYTGLKINYDKTQMV